MIRADSRDVAVSLLASAKSTSAPTISSHIRTPAASPKVKRAPKIKPVGTGRYWGSSRSSSGSSFFFVTSSAFVGAKSSNNSVVITFPFGLPSAPPFVDAFFVQK